MESEQTSEEFRRNETRQPRGDEFIPEWSGRVKAGDNEANE